ncbi:MAG: Asp23/Gls24 family envelope stress response protein [Candidatus Dormibacteraceae bacterium]|nr:Asp23/Gls24 family envelope stress response protein [Candidatus Acidoferrales bacterium]
MQQAASGRVRVANEVIASIAAMAAREIDGVAGLDSAGARHVADWIKRDIAHHGVRVLVDERRAIHLDVFLEVRSGAVILEVAERVQENVIEAVERMLELEVAETNVLVSSVSFGS